VPESGGELGQSTSEKTPWVQQSGITKGEQAARVEFDSCYSIWHFKSLGTTLKRR
jgi:hypothetical protein